MKGNPVNKPLKLYPLHINLYTTIDEYEKPTEFKRSMLDMDAVNKLDKNNNKPAFSAKNLKEYPFITADILYPLDMLMTWSYSDRIKLFFNEKQMNDVLNKPFSEYLVKYDNPTVEYNDYQKQRTYDKNVKTIIELIFPSRPVIRNISNTYDADIIKKINDKPLRINWFTKSYFPSYLKINGSTYTISKVDWINDFIKHPLYVEFIKIYTNFKDWVNGELKNTENKIANLPKPDSTNDIVYNNFKNTNFEITKVESTKITTNGDVNEILAATLNSIKNKNLILIKNLRFAEYILKQIFVLNIEDFKELLSNATKFGHNNNAILSKYMTFQEKKLKYTHHIDSNNQTLIKSSNVPLQLLFETSNSGNDQTTKFYKKIDYIIDKYINAKYDLTPGNEIKESVNYYNDLMYIGIVTINDIKSINLMMDVSSEIYNPSKKFLDCKVHTSNLANQLAHIFNIPNDVNISSNNNQPNNQPNNKPKNNQPKIQQSNNQPPNNQPTQHLIELLNEPEFNQIFKSDMFNGLKDYKPPVPTPPEIQNILMQYKPALDIITDWRDVKLNSNNVSKRNKLLDSLIREMNKLMAELDVDVRQYNSPSNGGTQMTHEDREKLAKIFHDNTIILTTLTYIHNQVKKLPQSGGKSRNQTHKRHLKKKKKCKKYNLTKKKTKSLD